MSPFPPLINHVTWLGLEVWPALNPAPLAAFHFVRLVIIHTCKDTHVHACRCFLPWFFLHLKVHVLTQLMHTHTVSWYLCSSYSNQSDHFRKSLFSENLFVHEGTIQRLFFPQSHYKESLKWSERLPCWHKCTCGWPKCSFGLAQVMFCDLLIFYSCHCQQILLKKQTNDGWASSSALVSSASAALQAHSFLLKT